jgi:hypothetical protein
MLMTGCKEFPHSFFFLWGGYSYFLSHGRKTKIISKGEEKKNL